MAEKSLWPELKVKREKTPYAILKEQATYLAENTNGLVNGLVTREVDKDGDIRLRFFFFTPALGNYRYLLVDVWHDPVMVYPVTETTSGEEVAASEAEFLEHLEEIFGSDNTQRVLSSLINQSMEGSD